MNIHTPGVEPIRRQKHGEEHYNKRIRLDSDRKPDKLGFPRWMARWGDFGPVCPNHILRVDHNQRNKNSNNCQNQESNLRQCQFSPVNQREVKYICPIADFWSEVRNQKKSSMFPRCESHLSLPINVDYMRHKRHLANVVHTVELKLVPTATDAPTTAPKLKIDQKILMKRPF